MSCLKFIDDSLICNEGSAPWSTISDVSDSSKLLLEDSTRYRGIDRFFTTTDKYEEF